MLWAQLCRCLVTNQILIFDLSCWFLGGCFISWSEFIRCLHLVTQTTSRVIRFIFRSLKSTWSWVWNNLWSAVFIWLSRGAPNLFKLFLSSGIKLDFLIINLFSVAGGDQGVLNGFFCDWATADISKHLPFIYNLSSIAIYTYLPAFKQWVSGELLAPTGVWFYISSVGGVCLVWSLCLTLFPLVNCYDTRVYGGSNHVHQSQDVSRSLITWVWSHRDTTSSYERDEQ